MKKLLFLSVVVSFLFLDTIPALSADIEIDGDFRVRGFYTDNLTDQSDSTQDEAAYNSMRFILNTTISAGVAKGVLTLDYTSQSNTGNLRFGSGGDGTNPDVPFGPADDRLALLQAYLEADLRFLKISAGRKMTILGHSIIMDDPADGFFVDIPLNTATLSIATLKIRDNTGSAVGISNSGSTVGTASDTDLYYGNLAFSPMQDLAMNLFLGYYLDRGPTFITATVAGSPIADAGVFIIGVTGDMNMGSLTIGGEVDFLTGKADLTAGGDVDVQGLNIEVFGVMDVGPANVGLTFLYGSGDDPADADINMNGINGNYPTGIIITNIGARSLAPKDGTCLSVTGGGLGGVPGCINGAGLLAVKGTASVSPMERVTLQGDIIWARSAENPSTTVSEKDVGIEIDGTVKLQVDEHFSLLAGLGYLIVGDFWQASCACSSPDDMIVGVLELRFVF